MDKFPNENIPRVQYLDLHKGTYGLLAQDIPLDRNMVDIFPNIDSFDYLNLAVHGDDWKSESETAERLMSPSIKRRYTHDMYPTSEGEHSQGSLYFDPEEDWDHFEFRKRDQSDQDLTLEKLLDRIFKSSHGKSTHQLYLDFIETVGKSGKPFLLIDAHGGRMSHIIPWLSQWGLGDGHGGNSIKVSNLLKNLDLSKYSAVVISACNGDKSKIPYSGNTPIYYSELDVGGREDGDIPPEVKKIPVR